MKDSILHLLDISTSCTQGSGQINYTYSNICKIATISRILSVYGGYIYNHSIFTVCSSGRLPHHKYSAASLSKITVTKGWSWRTEAGTFCVIGPFSALAAILALPLPEIKSMILRACIIVLIPMDSACRGT